MKTIIITIIKVFLVFGFFSEAKALTLFQDNFNEGNLDGWSAISDDLGTVRGSWTIENGVLQYDLSRTSQEAGYICLDLLVMPESFSVEYDFRMVASNNHTEPDHTHAFFNFHNWNHHVEGVFRQKELDPQSYDDVILIQTINGKRLPGHTSDYLVFLPFHEDEHDWHHFKYVKEGNLVSFYFDSKLVYNHRLPVSITGGSLVLSASAGTHQFDNVLITTPAPLARYPLDGHFSDTSGNGYDLIVTPDFDCPWTDGKYGQCVHIPRQQADNRSKEAPCAYGLQYPGTGGWSVMGWLLVEEKGGSIIQQFSPFIANRQPYRLAMTEGADGKFYFHIEDSRTNRSIVGYPTTDYIGSWVHVAGIYDYKSSLKLYVNGELKDEISTTLIPETATCFPTYVGGNTWGSKSEITLDEVRVYGYALTQQEVIEAMTGSQAPGADPSSEPVFDEKGTEGSGSVIHIARLNPTNGSIGYGRKHSVQ